MMSLAFMESKPLREVFTCSTRRSTAIATLGQMSARSLYGFHSKRIHARKLLIQVLVVLQPKVEEVHLVL